MGIVKFATDQFLAAVAAFKVAVPNSTRAQRRKFVASLVNAGNEWLAKFDAADNAAPAAFAATKQGQFDSYTASMADPSLDPVDPNA